MIDKISPERGTNPAGLLVYLFGPGKFNEHTDPHVVAAGPGVWVPAPTRENRPPAAGSRYPDVNEVVALGHDLDGPHLLHGTEFRGGHVWHCSLSVPAADGALTDGEWEAIANRAMDRLEFSEVSGRAGCHWVAVRHGLSIEGNDHIHIVVNLIRADGTKADIWNDRKKLGGLMTEIERDYGLTVVHGRAGAGMPGLSQAERQLHTRRGRDEADRTRLAREVRAAAAGSANEQDFVRALRRRGVLARPRYAPAGRSRSEPAERAMRRTAHEVTGYSVALRPQRGERPIWYGGGRLARDLTLPRLREAWSADPQSRQLAVTEWARRGRVKARVTGHGEFAGDRAWLSADRQVGAAVTRLTVLGADDPATWAGVAREAAGLYAGLSAQIEGQRPGPLAAAADTLARSAQTRRGQPRARHDGDIVRLLRGAKVTALGAGPLGGTSAGQSLMIRNMTRVVRLAAGAHAVRGEAMQAQRLADLARSELERVHRALAAPPPPMPFPRARVPDGGHRAERDQDLGR